MVTLPEDNDRARYLRIAGDEAPASRWLPARSQLAATARTVVAGNKPAIAHDPHSSLWVPLKEGGIARGALGIRCSRPYAYEDSTAAFLELVSDEVALALRNARSYEAIEDQRRRLEVVNSVGRRLASSLDRWSIMRTLREELSATLSFDGFILATITQTAEGPVAEGYQYVAGVEEVVPPVALAITGPSREAYETGKLVLGVAGASDERQLADAVFSVASDYLESTHMVLAYVDVAGLVSGFLAERGRPSTSVGPVLIDNAPFFRRMIDSGPQVAESVNPEPPDLGGPIGRYIFTRSPSPVLSAPRTQD